MDLIGDVSGKNILIVDDMVDSEGTLCEAAELLKKNKAKKLFAYGTHGIFTKGTKELSEHFEMIMTSNIHYQKETEKDNIGVIDVSGVFAEAILRAQKGLSISKLFD